MYVPSAVRSLGSDPTLLVRVLKVLGEEAPVRNLRRVVLPLQKWPITNSLMDVLVHDLER